MKRPHSNPAHCANQEDEDRIFWHNEKNGDCLKIVYKHWKGEQISRFPICRQEFIKLCQLMPRAKDLANRFSVAEEALLKWAETAFCERKFKTIDDLISQLGSKFTFNLRQLLREHAQKSPQVCIFMAKNYLQMRDQLPDEVQDISVETINYNIQDGKTNALWDGDKQAKKSPSKA